MDITGKEMHRINGAVNVLFTCGSRTLDRYVPTSIWDDAEQRKDLLARTSEELQAAVPSKPVTIPSKVTIVTLTDAEVSERLATLKK